MKKEAFSVVVGGVGGQGVITLAYVLGDAAMSAGYDVRGAELHGLSQRFGPLECHIRFGREVHSPVVTAAGADLIIALERMEALRALEFAGPRTTLLMDTRAAVPVMLHIKKIPYPETRQVCATARRFAKRVISVDAADIVWKAGVDPVTANMFLLGAASALKLIPISKSHLIEGIRRAAPAAFFETNKRVFELGAKHASKLRK